MHTSILGKTIPTGTVPFLSAKKTNSRRITCIFWSHRIYSTLLHDRRDGAVTMSGKVALLPDQYFRSTTKIHGLFK